MSRLLSFLTAEVHVQRFAILSVTILFVPSDRSDPGDGIYTSVTMALLLAEGWL